MAVLMMVKYYKCSGGQFNIKMLSYQYRKSHCGDKMISRLSYLHNRISYTVKTSLYWIRALVGKELVPSAQWPSRRSVWSRFVPMGLHPIAPNLERKQTRQPHTSTTTGTETVYQHRNSLLINSSWLTATCAQYKTGSSLAWLVLYSVPRHYQNQYWFLWTLQNNIKYSWQSEVAIQIGSGRTKSMGNGSTKFVYQIKNHLKGENKIKLKYFGSNIHHQHTQTHTYI